jgi:hypothetical protein
MILSSNAARFVLVLAAACNVVTSAQVGVEPPVDLGTAKEYVILVKSGISTVYHDLTISRETSASHDRRIIHDQLQLHHGLGWTVFNIFSDQ